MPDIHYPQVAIAQKKTKKGNLRASGVGPVFAMETVTVTCRRIFKKKKKRGKMSSRASWKYLELKPQNI